MPGDAYVKKEAVEHPGMSGTVQSDLERAERNIMEGDGLLGEAGPEVAPPAGEDACAHGSTCAAKALEDLEEQIIREGADEVY